MELVDWRTVVEKDFPEIGEMTLETIVNTEREGHSHRGDVRISTNRVWTDVEYESRRRKVLSEPLP